MDQHDDFDNVSWRHEPESDISRPTTSGTDAEESPATSHDANGKRRMSSAHENPQAGPLADAVDLAGIGDGVLECRVDSPLKENDGTKDAYISYLVTTQVSCPVSPGVTCGLFMAVHFHKPDRRFIEVREKADKLDEDLNHVEKIVARVARRESDLETDYNELATQFRKLVSLEPNVEVPLQVFAASVEETGRGLKGLKDHTDQNYLGSLRDMEAYILSLKALLKTREQKQLDFEALVDYRNKAVSERDSLATNPSSYYASNPLTSSPASFIRSKMEDMRGVDHEQSRRERVRKLELRIDELTREVESAKTTSEMFDEEVVREVADFERIKAVEFRDTLGALAEKHIDFYQGVLNTWERFVAEMEGDLDENHEGSAPQESSTTR
ncbi:unnamed protein product [Aspergillus oryzae]|uniref:Sorting nexin-4 n=2 Tax=Aspergillus oryzae TaxID=5062 RepID=A0AAN4Y807_ASPOZ|nr:unnamed protein product [Aspergillus oryzae]GMF85993.1 unnamed protein product [Aspergillus oryzae]GMG10999.1 unnamed protein product [Aspergillus oryzae]GMG22630.1 unnamed protein product [Aspergillus oryzae]GMG46881.1 unnamed protein product [Aspergillus oryzae var. brunneus]